MNTQDQKKKKRGKLLAKAAVNSILMAIVAMVLSGTILYMLFRQRAVENMEKSLKQDASVLSTEIYLYSNYSWLFDYWEEHYREMNVPPYGEDLNYFLEWFINMSDEFGDTALNRLSWDTLMEKSPEEQKDYAEYSYFQIFDDLTSYTAIFDNDRISCFKPDENDPFNFMTILKENEDKLVCETNCGLGADFPFPIQYHPELQKVLDEGELLSEVETYRSTSDGKEYSSVYAPIITFDGDTEKLEKVQAVISVTRSMDELNQGVWKDVLRFEGWIALAIGIVIALELARLYYGMIRPTVRIQKEIRSYTKTWDSASLTKGLTEHSPNNELGQLTDDLILMGEEIDLHVHEVEKATAEKERIGTELNMATSIQASQLPNIFPAYPERKEFDLFASMKPAKEVGGDFYDFFFVDDDHIALVMADVSGKGVPAALFMMISKILIKSQLKNGESPGEALNNANNELCENNDAGLFVTVWAAVIEISTGKGVSVNAGHEHPAYRKGNGNFELLEYEHDLAVAAFPGVPFGERQFRMEPGDCLFVYTDGVAEAQNAEHKLFEMDRMIDVLNQDPTAEPEQLIKNVTKGIKAFVDKAEQFDDITMLCFRYLGPDK